MKHCQILIFVFLNLLNQFLAIFWAFWHPLFTAIIFFIFFQIYVFDLFVFSSFLCGDPKIGYNRCPLFTILTKKRLCVVSFVKINKTNLSKLVFSSLVDQKTHLAIPFIKGKRLCVVWLNWDSFCQSPLIGTEILCGWAKLRFLSPIPFNRNQNPKWFVIPRFNKDYSCKQDSSFLFPFLGQN